jgi:TolB protein
MASAGDWFKLEASAGWVIEPLQNPIVGRCPTTELGVHDLDRGPQFALAEGEVDCAAFELGVSPREGHVPLRCFAGLELPREFTMGVRVEGEDDDPRGITVESVDDSGPRKSLRSPCGEAILLVGADSRDRQQPSGLVEDHQPAVVVKDRRESRHERSRLAPSMTLLATSSFLALVTTFVASQSAPSQAPAAPPAAPAAPAATGQRPAAPAETIDWKTAEQGILENHVQLTFADRFVKAGEAYFSPDDKRVIFQAVERMADGSEPPGFYAMFVGDVVRSGSGAITGLSNIKLLSPPGSANTCGWFDPIDPMTVIFASTLTAPSEGDTPGYQRGSGRYRWMFPPEMRIVLCDLKKADGSASWQSWIQPILGDGKGYVAEGSTTADGKWMVYCDHSKGNGDLWILNRQNGETRPLVEAPGYDGGPFFSPDNKRICYRSDRAGNNMLQIYVADLAFDTKGHITGISAEYQVTRDANVNWCPFFHPSGKFLVFASSAASHSNYEVFAIDAGVVDRDGVKQFRYGTNQRRVTHAAGADVLPVFSSDGKWLLWTGQRDEQKTSQLYVAEWKMPVDPKMERPSGGPPPAERRPTEGRPAESGR